VTSGPADQFGAHVIDAYPEPEQPDRPERAQPETPRTGDDAVDAAVQQLAGISDRPLDDQLAGYDTVHRTLQDRLADVEG